MVVHAKLLLNNLGSLDPGTVTRGRLELLSGQVIQERRRRVGDGSIATPGAAPPMFEVEETRQNLVSLP